MKIAFWVFCARKHTTKFKILTFGEINTIRFSNFNRIRIRILFGFGKSGEYEYEYIRFWKIIRIRIRILFGLKISAEYEYEYHYSVSTIRILFEYRIIRSPLIWLENHRSWLLLHWLFVYMSHDLPALRIVSLRFIDRFDTVASAE